MIELLNYALQYGPIGVLVLAFVILGYKHSKLEERMNVAKTKTDKHEENCNTCAQNKREHFKDALIALISLN